MSRQITQPVNQVRLTNVAVVRLTKGGKRFEVACYKNKIVDYRNGHEKDIDEVLQAETIFTNVSKGVLANKKVLKSVFGIDDEALIIEKILRNGQVQISEKERDAYYENIWREVSNLVSEKCVNPANNRRYAPDIIRQAMKLSEFSAHPTRSVKQQFLDCVKLLIRKKILPIQRAKMHLKLTIHNEIHEDAIAFVNGRNGEIIPNTNAADAYESSNTEIEFLLDPSLYRDMETFCAEQTVEARLDVVQLTVIEQGDAGLDIDLARRINVSNIDQKSSPDEDLVKVMEEKLKVKEEYSFDEYGNTPTNSRKIAKKAQKKSKKAKRREKEEEAERLARREKEAVRQQERIVQLKEKGIDVNKTLQTDGNDQDGLSSCNTCGGSFTKSQYRAHFRSDWHRYNLKLKMQGVACISEEEFKLADVDFL